MEHLKTPEQLNETVEKINTLEVNGSTTIYTVIPYYSNGYEVDQSRVKSFTTFKNAEEYTWTLHYNFEVVQNELT
jgi:hypothetical protein